jgi:hypothetical protein
MIKLPDHRTFSDTITEVVVKTILEDVPCLSFDDDFSQLRVIVTG